MKAKLIRSLVLSLVLSPVAFAGSDSCDDYFQRHYKADLMPVTASLSEVPHQGDIAGFQQLAIGVTNIGNRPILGPSGGIIAANSLYVAVRRANGAVENYQAFLPAPLVAGAGVNVPVSLPSGHFHNCEKVSITIDTRRTANQYGCACYGNDSKTFRLQLKGAVNCNIFAQPHKPHPFP